MEVEEALGARTDILREIGVDEDVDRREEERVANAVEDLDQNDRRGALRHERVDGEAGGVAEDAHDHRGAPTELL